MNKQFNMTIDLSPTEVKQAIVLYVQKHIADGMSVTEKDVLLEIGTHYEDRPGGSSWPTLKGATVKVKAMGPYQDR